MFLLRSRNKYIDHIDSQKYFTLVIYDTFSNFHHIQSSHGFVLTYTHVCVKCIIQSYLEQNSSKTGIDKTEISFAYILLFLVNSCLQLKSDLNADLLPLRGKAE